MGNALETIKLISRAIPCHAWEQARLNVITDLIINCIVGCTCICSQQIDYKPFYVV
jgi:hypothetical protein